MKSQGTIALLRKKSGAKAMDSVVENDSLLNTFALDGLEQRGDARSAWGAIDFCIKQGIDFPPWVLRYLLETAGRIEDHLVNRDKQHPQRLWRALGLDQENKPDHFDYKRDPEEIYEVIKTWITDGEVKNPTEGARRYRKDVLRGFGSIETVRNYYYAGKKIVERCPGPDVAFDQMTAKNPRLFRGDSKGFEVPREGPPRIHKSGKKWDDVGR